MKRIFSRFGSKQQPTAIKDTYEVTPEGFCLVILERMGNEEPPFDHNEWHLASLEIPSDWEIFFELACHTNALTTCVGLINESHGTDRATEVAEIFTSKLEAAGEGGPRIAALFVAQLFAMPLSSEHPVFMRDDAKEWSKHLFIFGQAAAALNHFQIEERHKPEALSRLGRCMVYASHCSRTRLGQTIPKVRFIGN